MSNCHYCDELEQNCGRHGVSEWVPTEKEMPGNPRCVLATDGEAHFIAIYAPDDCMDIAPGWSNAHTEESIDSVITHWMELPEVPE